MKTGILTFQFADNYGAVLQAYALMKYLSGLGAEAEIINYNNSIQRTVNRSTVNKLKSWLWAYVRRMIAGDGKHRFFEQFRREKLAICVPCLHNDQELERYLSDNGFDSVVVGSDQVWNPLITGKDLSYLLHFQNEGIKKLSYAASFGQTKVEKEWVQSVVNSIKSFRAVSVRETTAKRILKEGGATEEIAVVADPVFLLDGDEWGRLSEALEFPKRKYLLCYIMPGDKTVERAIEASAKKLSRERKLDIIFLGRKEYKKFANDGLDLVNASPEEFISLFRNAEAILTNSFHGTAFSVIFEKEFYSFVNPSLAGESQLGSRITDLLNELGLSDRCIQGVLGDPHDLDPEEVRRKRTAFVNRSKAYLHKALFD